MKSSMMKKLFFVLALAVCAAGCSKNDSDEQYRSGKRCQEERNFKEAVICFRKAAAQRACRGAIQFGRVS